MRLQSTGLFFGALLGALAQGLAGSGGFSAARPVFAAGPVSASELAGPAPVEPKSAAPDAPAAVKSAGGSQQGAADVTSLEDAVEPLVPRKPRTEVEEDRLEAMALFAAARTNEQRQELPLALRQYERALRCDRRATAALSEIVALAFNLDRRTEAARYARLIVPKNADDANLLRRLGLELAEEQDWAGALALYEKVAALQPQEKPTASSVMWWLETGRLYYLTRQYEAAARQFAQLMAALERPADFGLSEAQRKSLLGTSDVAYQLFGECFLDAGQPERAQAAFEKANALKDNAPLLAYNLARVAVASKQPELAREQLEKYLQTNRPDEGMGPYQLLGTVLASLQAEPELIPRLEKLHAQNPANLPLAVYLADRLRAAGRKDEAEKLYQQLCQTAGRRPPVDAYQALVGLMHEQKRWEDLMALLAGALPKTGGLDPLGEAGKQLVADEAAVQALLDVAGAQRQTPDDEGGRSLAAALLAMEIKKYDLAGEYFALAVAAAPKRAAERMLTWGLEMLAASQFAQSIKVFRQGIDQHVLPAENPAFHFYLAGALAMGGQTDEALAEARRAAELQPESARFASRIGWILYHAKRYDDARAAYAEFLRRFDANYDSADTRDVLHDARLVLSNIEVLTGNMADAEEWLEQVLDEYPGDAGAQNDLGYLWADQAKHLERALGMLQEAVAAEPKNLAYRDSLGWAYFRMHRYGEAVAELQIATAVEKPDGIVLDHLGDALFAQGDTPAALAAWTKAAGAFDKEDDKPKSKQTQDKIDRARAKAS